MLIKVKFTKDDKPVGRNYTYRSKIPVDVGDQVDLPNGGIGIVTEVNIPESEVKVYKDRIKEIVGKKENCT